MIKNWLTALLLVLFVVGTGEAGFAKDNGYNYLLIQSKEPLDKKQGVFLKITHITRIYAGVNPENPKVTIPASVNCETTLSKFVKIRKNSGNDVLEAHCIEGDQRFEKMFSRQITGEWYYGWWMNSPDEAMVRIVDFSLVPEAYQIDKKEFLKNEVSFFLGLQNEVWAFSPTEETPIKKKTYKDFVVKTT